MRNGTRIGYDSVRTRGENSYEARIFWNTSDGRGHEKEVVFPLNAKFRRIFLGNELISEASVTTPFEHIFSDINQSTPNIRIEVDDKTLVVSSPGSI